MKISKLKPFRTTKLVFWLSLAGAIVALGLYVYLFYTVQKIGQHTAALTAETRTLEAEESEVGKLKKDLAANQARQPILVSYFIDASDPVPFLETIEGYGRATNVTVKFDTVDIKRAPNQLAVTLTSDGNFADLYRFMALVESAPYEFAITNADIRSVIPAGLTPAQKSGHVNAWQARISISVFSVTGVQNIPTQK